MIGPRFMGYTWDETRESTLEHEYLKSLRPHQIIVQCSRLLRELLR